MITSAIARYNVCEIIGTLNHELHNGDNTPETREKNANWITINLSEMYGLNMRFDRNPTPQYRSHQLSIAPRSRELLFKFIKPPVFQYGTAPNFECEVILRKDDILVLSFE